MIFRGTSSGSDGLSFTGQTANSHSLFGSWGLQASLK